MAPYPTGTCANCTNHGVLKYARRTMCTRYIERDRVNFVAKFDVDNGAATDLSLESSMYDGSPSAEYELWLLLEPVLAPTEAAALAAAGGAIVAVRRGRTGWGRAVGGGLPWGDGLWHGPSRRAAAAWMPF